MSDTYSDLSRRLDVIEGYAMPEYKTLIFNYEDALTLSGGARQFTFIAVKSCSVFVSVSFTLTEKQELSCYLNDVQISTYKPVIGTNGCKFNISAVKGKNVLSFKFSSAFPGDFSFTASGHINDEKSDSKLSVAGSDGYDVIIFYNDEKKSFDVYNYINGDFTCMADGISAISAGIAKDGAIDDSCYVFYVDSGGNLYYMRVSYPYSGLSDSVLIDDGVTCADGGFYEGGAAVYYIKNKRVYKAVIADGKIEKEDTCIQNAAKIVVLKTDAEAFVVIFYDLSATLYVA